MSIGLTTSLLLVSMTQKPIRAFLFISRDTTYFMAKTSTVARSQKKPKFASRVVRRCFRCGRKRGYMREFDMCRICFRELANEGMIPGIKKSSW